MKPPKTTKDRGTEHSLLQLRVCQQAVSSPEEALGANPEDSQPGGDDKDNDQVMLIMNNLTMIIVMTMDQQAKHDTLNRTLYNAYTRCWES